MAKYTRIAITDLCKQLERDANNLVSLHPAISGRMKSAALLLRLTTQLADIQEIETIANNLVVLPKKQLS
jgi:hypothetical protein